jgi:hypothetical protein
MKVCATRGDVHPGDESTDLRFDIADDAAPEAILRAAVDRRWLPSIRGDRATWVITSNELLAVVAYEWPDLRFMPMLELRMPNALRSNGALRLHFNYLGQVDPEMIYRALWGIRLHPSP